MKRTLQGEEYRLLVENAPILIWRADRTMGCDYFNEVWLKFTGRTISQEVGNGWAEGVHPDDLQRCLKIYTEHFARRDPFEMEYRLRRSDGAFRWLFDRGVPFFDDDQQFLGYIGSCVDVTERVEAQEVLRRSQEAEIRTLRGFLPICSYCKKIRNDGDYWERLESYISSRTEALFSHGICPDCLPGAMAEFDEPQIETKS